MQVLIPCKTLVMAKSRLGDLLSSEERSSLSIAMLQDVVNTLKASAGVTSIAILTDDRNIITYALGEGLKVVEEKAVGLNFAMDRFAESLSNRNIRSLLVLPADIPAVQPEDIKRLICAETGYILIVPSSEDQGTNALLCCPPGLINFRFGPDSANKHITAAAEIGIKIQIISVPNIMRDIDRPADLIWFLKNGKQCTSRAYLELIKMEQRLAVAGT